MNQKIKDILDKILGKKSKPRWWRHPNPYLQLHLEVYPNYLKELDNGTYDPSKDPFCSSAYILSHPFKSFEDVREELKERYGKDVE